MSTKLYVSSLPFSVNNNEELEKIFSAIGTVVTAKIITDSATGKGKGFGFIEMESEALAAEAVKQLHGSSYGGRTISVAEARSESKNKNEDNEPTQEAKE